MPFQLKALNENGDRDKLVASLGAILQTNVLLSLATISPEGEPHVNTAYFSYSLHPLCLYIFTSPETLHAKNTSRHPTVGVNIFDSYQPFASDLFGIQMTGTCVELSRDESDEAFRLYSARFPKLLARAPDIEAVFARLTRRFYRIKIQSGKLLDEPAFGKQVLIQLQM